MNVYGVGSLVSELFSYMYVARHNVLIIQVNGFNTISKDYL